MKMGSIVNCIDNTGVVKCKVFQIKGNGRTWKQEAKYGDIVYVVIKLLNLKANFFKDRRRLIKFKVGSVHRAVIVHLKQKLRRKDRSYIWFRYNSVVILTKGLRPFGNKVKGVVPREIIKKFPSFGSISEGII